MRQDGEPSVEEILESIKKVIARDNRESAEEARRRREADRDADRDEHEEVLELDAEAELIEERAADEPAEPAPLVDRVSRDAMRESLAALAVLAEPGAPPQIVRSGETSLEGLTRELLRPMLAQWLERNLPDMVERMVSAEIARIAGKKG
jgi:cell pole-organizing protein PopZ